MKANSIATAVTLALLMVGNSVILSAPRVTAGDQTTSAIPPQLAQYLSTLPYSGHNLCISGTLDPFTLESHPCPKASAADIQSSYNLNCSSECQVGELYTPSNNYSYFSADATRPSSVPYYSYCASGCSYTATGSYWIGLQTCTGSGCGSATSLLQVGVFYGFNTTYTSAHPIEFEEFWTNSSSNNCFNHFCGDETKSISSGDSLFFSITENTACCGGSSYWDLYSEDVTSNIYDDYVVYVGTSSGQIDYSSIHYSLTVSEGKGTGSSNYFPGNFTFTNEFGEDTSFNYQLGTHRDWHFASGTSPTATIDSYTFSCTYGTCAKNSIAWS